MGGGLSGTGNRAKECRVSRSVCATPHWGTWRTNRRLDVVCGKELVAVCCTYVAHRPGDFEPSETEDGHGRQSRGGTRCPALPHESPRLSAMGRSRSTGNSGVQGGCPSKRNAGLPG